MRELTICNVEELLKRGAKSIVVACNTATSAAVALLRKMYPDLPLVGIEPAIKPAVLGHPGGRIVVMATPMTLHQDKFRKLMSQHESQAQIISLPCPGLMEFIERGDLDGEDLREYLSRLLANVNQENADAVVLGCTHYPFAREMITQVIGAGVEVYDGGNGTAREMKRRLLVADKLSDAAEKGTVEFFNSRDTREERELCEYLLSR